MIWLKSVVVGIAAALVTCIAIAGILLTTARWSMDINEGSGGVWLVTVNVADALVLLPTMLAFALGFWWSVRRERRRRSVPGA